MRNETDPAGSLLFHQQAPQENETVRSSQTVSFSFIRLEDALGLEAMLEGRGMDGVAERRLRRDLALAD